jgi:hypothetical protein
VDFWLPTRFDVLMSNVIVWDIETVPDLKGFAAADGHAGKSDDEVRAYPMIILIVLFKQTAQLNYEPLARARERPLGRGCARRTPRR